MPCLSDPEAISELTVKFRVQRISSLTDYVIDNQFEFKKMT